MVLQSVYIVYKYLKHAGTYMYIVHCICAFVHVHVHVCTCIREVRGGDGWQM